MVLGFGSTLAASVTMMNVALGAITYKGWIARIEDGRKPRRPPQRRALDVWPQMRLTLPLADDDVPARSRRMIGGETGHTSPGLLPVLVRAHRFQVLVDVVVRPARTLRHGHMVAHPPGKPW